MFLPCKTNVAPSTTQSQGAAFLNPPPVYPCKPPNGVFYLNSQVHFRDVTDGTSTTMAIGETSWRFDSHFCAGTLANPLLVAQGGSTWAGTTKPFLQEHVLAAAIDPINRGDFAGRSRGFNSFHTGGAQFLMLDGSVRFISESIQQVTQPPYGVFQHLASKSGGEVIGEF
ncbi:MAG: DUF1559 domain-containing protein [Planctomycetaceae bacterium]|nr:DUF1559 domain-containing protein [Planctomycetaceae bacterium]